MSEMNPYCVTWGTKIFPSPLAIGLCCSFNTCTVTECQPGETAVSEAHSNLKEPSRCVVLKICCCSHVNLTFTPGSGRKKNNFIKLIMFNRTLLVYFVREAGLRASTCPYIIRLSLYPYPWYTLT